MQATSVNNPTVQLASRAGERLLAKGQELDQAATKDAEEVRDAFVSFFGETFFSQMLKAMRSSVGKPAYFHGGRAEEVFQSQLDQTLTEEMTEASADKLGEPLFANQFPHLAQILSEAKDLQQGDIAVSLNDLNGLRRR
ncbi:MAG: rod-binding protein [Planctomycetales bacterium]|nr:rod-binding protein [Planctomycetales bacterium]